MQYLLLIYRNEAELSKMTPADRQAMSAEYGAYTQSIVQSGQFQGRRRASADHDGDHRARA